MMGILSTLQDAIYDQAAHYGELKALERLFTKQYLQGIEKSEAQALGASPLRKVCVDLAWIDKIPLAMFCPAQNDLAGHPINGRVELGDLLIHRTDSVLTPTKAFIRDSRSAIVQAKLSDSKQPSVPVGRISPTRATSTSKEIKLLQDWPNFHLFETSRNSTPILRNVSAKSSASNSFFWAFIKPSKIWLSGEATDQAPCSETLDEFFAKLRGHTYGECVQNKNAWADLTFHTLGTARNRKIPPSLNNEIRSRVQSATYQVAGLGGLPFLRRPMAVLMIDTFIDETGEKQRAP